MHLLIGQAETMAKAATDLVSARDVVPFMGAAIALLLVVVAYIFKLWRDSEKARADERTAELQRLTQINDRLSKAGNKGD
ncbi:MAG: hypothetical protein KF878_00110 [Planctomycetes bacterium]|nr:hypothetical protein [Planctomycetota bacterium]